MTKYMTFGAVVQDAGGGLVTLWVDRDTDQYPSEGAHVAVTVEVAEDMEVFE